MASQNLSIPYQDIDERLSNIGTPADSPSESGSLHAKVKALQNEPSLHDLWLKAGATHQAKNLEYVYGIIDVSKVTVNNESFGAGANKLTNIYLRGLKKSIDLHFLPALTVKDSTDSSLGYMVENAANTEPITITLHPDAFIRLEESLIQKARKSRYP